MQEQRQIGTVLRFDAANNFGFLDTGDDCPNVFSHRYDVEGRRSLDAGTRVSFIETVTPKGRRALDVVIEDEGRA